MSKRFALPLVAALALVSVSARSFGAAPPPNNDDVCLSMSYTVNNQQVPVSLTYDTTTGVVVEIRRVDFSTVYAALPITVGDEPNPHFDRLYALLMKGFDSARIERVCVDRQPSSGEFVELRSVSLRHISETPAPEVQRVQVCDWVNPNRCARINSSGRLEVAQ